MVVTNKAGRFTVSDPTDDLWMFRLFRVQRGIIVNGGPEYVTLGTYVVDQPEMQMALAYSGTLRVGGMDRLSLARETRTTQPLAFDADMRIADVIRYLANYCGLDMLYDVDTASDVLYNLDDAGLSLGTNYTLGSGENVQQAMADIVASKGLELFMDAESVLVLRPTPDPTTLPSEWTFEVGEDNFMTQVTKSLSAANWFNHTVAIGEGADRDPVRAEAMDLNPSSPGYIGTIGHRVRPDYSSNLIVTQYDAQQVAQALLYLSALVEESISGNSITHPGFYSGMAISINNPGLEINDKYVVDRVETPWVSGQSSLETRKTRQLSI